MPRRSRTSGLRANASDVTYPAPEPTLRDLRTKLRETQAKVQVHQQSIDAASKELEAKLAGERSVLQQHQETAKDLRVQIETARNSVLVDILRSDGVLDALAPEHDRTSCSDEKTCNTERCTRCALIEAAKQRYIDFSWSFQISGC